METKIKTLHSKLSNTKLFFFIIIISCLIMGGCTESSDSSDSSGGRIIADHTAVDRYDDIPAEYMAAVKQMLVDIAGESHSEAYRTGMDLLEAQDANYAVQTFDGSIPAVSDSYVRLGRHGSVGEEDFYTNEAAKTTIKTLITTQAEDSNSIHVIGFGWCWDMTSDNFTNTDGTNERDPVYNVHWYGRSADGPEGNYIWGLDSADTAITGNSVCMETYLNAVDEYNRYSRQNGYLTKAIFTTGPVDGNNGGTEIGFQREVKHDYIRAYVAANQSRVLFDYADILCYNDAGEVAEYTWDDSGTERVYRGIHSDNAGSDTGHIGNAGALRLAKAMWWMLARIAGWDGN